MANILKQLESGEIQNLSWIKVAMMALEIVDMAEDGKIDDIEWERIKYLTVPYVAKMFKTEDKPVEKWKVVTRAVDYVQSVIEEMKKQQGQTN